jgi:bifunctional DNase/RNase
VPRPLTHDLLRSVITTLGAVVTRIVVWDLNEDTFYAKIILQVNGTTMEIDSRPSDAIALAVRTDSPIFAYDTVIEKAGVQMDGEGRPIPRDDDGGESQPVREEELKSLSAFTDFIETLNLDDLGKEEMPPSSESSPSGETG